MMTVEGEAHKRSRNSKLQQAILGTLYAAGALTLAAMAPNALSLLGYSQKRWSQNNLRSAVGRMREKGFIEFTNGKFVLTPLGEQYLRQTMLSVKKPKRWDGKWRVVIFDVPQQRNALRNRLRDTLLRIGFIRLQHSVWIFPYDCEELITLLKADYRVGREVLYMIVDSIENDRSIRSRFGLT